jgi:hypothetical protein
MYDASYVFIVYFDFYNKLVAIIARSFFSPGRKPEAGLFLSVVCMCNVGFTGQVLVLEVKYAISVPSNSLVGNEILVMALIKAGSYYCLFLLLSGPCQVVIFRYRYVVKTWIY